MNIDRRALRRKLGSRSSRRSGTKTKALPGKNQPGVKTPEYTYFRRQKARPRTRLAMLIREEEKKAQKKG